MLVAGVIAGCTPEPTPQSSPTLLFSTEQEAFAAAEAVFREYNSALINWRTDENGADPLEFVTGKAYEGSLEALRHLEANGFHFIGESRIISIQRIGADLEAPAPEVVTHVCVDNSSVRVVDRDGVDVTPVTRDGVAAFEITFVVIEGDWRISQSQLHESGTC